MARLFISAVGKSSGKTTLTIGLAAAFARRGLDVRCFKKGPDYIDPMWHAAASGRACFNLDFNAQTRDEILATFGRGAAGGDISLIEGNKGLHDGVDEEGADSSAALAKLLRAPVLLVIDAEGMARGVAPLALGYSAFDRDVTIAGIALNKVGTPRQEGKLRRALERYTDLPVLGAIARDEALDLEERHLGLATPAETAHRDARIDAMAEVVLHNLDLDRVLAIAREAPALAEPAACAPAPVARDVTVAIARDAAFGFYYVDDLEALERAGARLVFFDALRDARLPPADALFVGGGFPETHAEALSANAALRRDVAAALAGGMPAYAECGGLMYLARSIEWRGRRHPMVGAVPA
ncbi:MAG: cobyrinate a,c-diamide synthase, partial [Hyphomicrobiales bacterium]|nr:cobyrinate a,c-diamide synthase [Hyphomicrobiales bacterium]